MHERKTYIVDRPFQFSFIVKNLLLLVLAFSMVFLAIHLWEKHQVKQGFLLRPPQNSEVRMWASQHGIREGSPEYLQLFLTRAKVYTYFDLLWKPLLGVLLINILIMVALNVYYSHKIAGPVFRLKKTLRQKLDGQAVEPVRFRKNDEFQELADLVNQLMEKK